MPPEEIPSTTPAGGEARPGPAAAAGDGTYRLMFERSPLPGWVFDSETLRFLAVNGAAAAGLAIRAGADA